MAMVIRGGLYAVALVTAYMSWQPATAGRPVRKVPLATLTALVVVGVPSVAQLTVGPGLLDVLERDWLAIGDGQVWRLVTALVVQDGGPAGAAFNLISLAVIGTAAEKCWEAGRWAAIALTAGVGAQFWGWVVQPVGAGNSVAVFGLAASLAVVGLSSGGWRPRVLGVTSLAASTVLLLVGDIHGGAAALGGILGAVLLRRSAGTPPTTDLSGGGLAGCSPR